jgi:hypothetical protein
MLYWILVIIVGTLLALVIYALTKPIVEFHPQFSSRSTKRIKYVDIPGSLNATNLVYLPVPPQLAGLKRYQVNLPYTTKANQTLRFVISFSKRVQFQVYKSGENIEYAGVPGTQQVTMATRKRSDGSVEWYVANATRKYRGSDLGCPSSGPNTIFPPFDALQNAFNAISQILDGDGSTSGAISIIYDTFINTGDPNAELVCMFSALYNQIQTTTVQTFLAQYYTGFITLLGTIQTGIGTYMEAKNNVAPVGSVTIPFPALPQTLLEYKQGGDPNIVSSTTQCQTQQSRDFYFGFTSENYCLASTSSLFQMIDALTGQNAANAQYSIPAIVSLLTNGFTFAGVLLSPQQLSICILPLLQMIAYYVGLVQEVWRVFPLQAGSTNNPWIVQTVGYSYETFRDNMIQWLQVLEVNVLYLKELMLQNYVTTTGPQGSQQDNAINDQVGLSQQLTLPEPGTNDTVIYNLNYCAWGPSAPCVQPPGTNSNSYGIALLSLGPSGAFSFASPFNGSLNYWNNRTCYNNSNDACCWPNDIRDTVPNVLQTTTLISYENANKVNVLDFPSNTEYILSKYLATGTSTTTFFNNTDMQLGQTSSLLCYDTTANYQLGPTIGPTGPLGPLDPQVNESPADEFPIHQQMFIDRWFGRYAHVPGYLASDGPGDLDNIMTQMYSISGLIPSFDPIHSAAIKMPYITLSGDPNNYMPGAPFGYTVGTFLDANSYLYCTKGTQISPALNNLSNSVCETAQWGLNGSTEYVIVPPSIVDDVVDATTNLNFPTGPIGCPVGTNLLLTCLQPTLLSGSPAVVSPSTPGQLGSPAPSSRILLCANDTQLNGPINGPTGPTGPATIANPFAFLWPAVDNCGSGGLPSLPPQFPCLARCTSFWSGNLSFIPPVYQSNGISYNQYDFLVSTPGTLNPVLGSYITFESEDYNVRYTCIVTASGDPTAGFPTAPSNDVPPVNVPLSFVPIDQIVNVGNTQVLVAYVYAPPTQRAQLAYNGDFVNVYYGLLS